MRTALDIGYRLIDTAFIYRNEANIGKVLHEYLKENKKMKRKELFITTKVQFSIIFYAKFIFFSKNKRKECKFEINEIDLKERATNKY